MNFSVDPRKNIPDKSSNSGQWKSWHEALDNRYGKKMANEIWILAWNKRSSPNANDADLRRYMEKNGVIVERDLFAKVGDMQLRASEWINDFLQWGKVASIGITIVVVGGIALFVWNYRKKAPEIGNMAKNIGKRYIGLK